MRAWTFLAALMAFLWPQPASATQSFCFREPSGWWNSMMTELPVSMNRIRLTRSGTFWNGTRVTPAQLRERLRGVRAMQQPIFTLLEYEMWAGGCPAIDRLRDTVSSALVCSPELCGETIVDGYYRPRRRSPQPDAAALRQAERDIERAVRRAERALDAMEREEESRVPPENSTPK